MRSAKKNKKAILTPIDSDLGAHSLKRTGRDDQGIIARGAAGDEYVVEHLKDTKRKRARRRYYNYIEKLYRSGKIKRAVKDACDRFEKDYRDAGIDQRVISRYQPPQSPSSNPEDHPRQVRAVRSLRAVYEAIGRRNWIIVHMLAVEGGTAGAVESRFGMGRGDMNAAIIFACEILEEHYRK